MSTPARRRLRALLDRPGPFAAPGVCDGLTARCALEAGAECLYMTGFGVAGSLLGQPDLGLVTVTEMADRVRALAAVAGDVPLIADGDNGHGGPLNAMRLTRLYEQAGAACVHIEDQAFPKRCGHMESKVTVPLEDALANLRAVLRARTDPDFLVMARTDTRATVDLDEALRRGDAFLEAGADILFIEAPRSEDEMRVIAERFRGVPLLANMVEAGKTPYLDVATLGEMGFKVVIFPISGVLVGLYHMRRAYARLLQEGRLPEDEPHLTFADYNALIGLPQALESAEACGGPAGPATSASRTPRAR